MSERSPEPGPKRTLRTVCKVGACKPFCGIEVDVENGKMSAVRPDPEHSLSEGYVCIKGMSILGSQNSPDRLLHPRKRDGSAWKRMGWLEATAQIGRRLRETADRVRDHHPA